MSQENPFSFSSHESDDYFGHPLSPVGQGLMDLMEFAGTHTIPLSEVQRPPRESVYLYFNWKLDEVFSSTELPELKDVDLEGLELPSSSESCVPEDLEYNDDIQVLWEGVPTSDDGFVPEILYENIVPPDSSSDEEEPEVIYENIIQESTSEEEDPEFIYEKCIEDSSSSSESDYYY